MQKCTLVMHNTKQEFEIALRELADDFFNNFWW
jgi:hypothetical protein